ncbi:hypothetical protein DFR50_15720 [Roseiarcus fermentans]|uniref:Uncharacterized protein n=1 Tax=Roseiarcus fermentans TaxID=1473586 RepID=A0A366EG09_9HYPH|nr:hypothetical protein [Roseiarcus fermentans]RBP01258.1 hypothetical protein DFR50_15720 [Roseiarcus fermentans]
MSPSDLIGGLGGIFIAAPAVKDQIYRFYRDAEDRKAKSSPWPGLRQAAGRAWERRRNDYDGLDSFMTMIGALAITLSFVLKLFDA